MGGWQQDKKERDRLREHFGGAAGRKEASRAAPKGHGAEVASFSDLGNLGTTQLVETERSVCTH